MLGKDTLKFWFSLAFSMALFGSTLAQVTCTWDAKDLQCNLDVNSLDLTEAKTWTEARKAIEACLTANATCPTGTCMTVALPDGTRCAPVGFTFASVAEAKAAYEAYEACTTSCLAQRNAYFVGFTGCTTCGEYEEKIATHVAGCRSYSSPTTCEGASAESTATTTSTPAVGPPSTTTVTTTSTPTAADPPAASTVSSPAGTRSTAGLPGSGAASG